MKTNFYSKMGLLVAFILPITYVGIILAVIIHEVIGHGLTSYLLGGTFDSFTIKLDGMGWMNGSWNNISRASDAIINFSGVLYTTIFGILFIVIAKIFKKKTLIALTFLIFSLLCILDGAPYLFWDGLYTAGVGDISKIVQLYPQYGLSMILLGGIIMVLGIFYLNFLIFRTAISNTADNNSGITGKKRVMLAALFLLFQMGAWFAFDWNQLIPGINLIPSICGTILTFISLVFCLIFYKPETNIQENNYMMKWPIIIAWITAIIVVIWIIIFAQDGVVVNI